MRTPVVSGLVILALLGGFIACDESSSPGPSGFDAGTFDVFVPGNGNPSEAGPGGGEDAGDAGGSADAGGDAGKTLNALYAQINTTLVSVNPDTGAVTDVADIASAGAVALAWDRVAKVARLIKGQHSPVGGASTPKLGTIDLCTGAVTEGPAITVGGTQVRRAEALAQDPTTGIFYITVGVSADSTATEFQTEKTGTIDVATGAVTVNGAHTTLQNDGDCLTFIGSTLKLLDAAVAINSGALYTIDKTSGAASGTLTTGGLVLRVAYDETRDVVFTTAGTGGDPNATARSIGKLNLTTGANTPLGTIVPDGAYGGGNIYTLLSAPTPVCH